MKKLVTMLLLSAALSMSASSQAQTYEAAQGAYDDKDYSTAFSLASELANSNDARAQVLLGKMYEEGQGVPENYKHNISQALFWFQKAADQGNAAGQYKLGWHYSRGGPGVNQDEARGVTLLEMAANQGDSDAISELGHAYSWGTMGVKCDTENAKAMFLKLSKQGDSRNPLTSIGNMYSSNGGPFRSHCAATNDREAVKWFGLAAKNGEKAGAYQLGYAYYEGLGVTRNVQQAAVWMRTSANNGYALAQATFGYMLAMGKGVPQDDEEAVQWLRKAADFGIAEAQVDLGTMYKLGRGVEMNPQTAYFWWLIAAKKSSNENAKRAMNSIEPTLSESQRVAAMVSAKNWKSSIDRMLSPD